MMTLPIGLLRQRNTIHGMSAVMIAHRTALKTGVMTDLLTAAERAGGDVEAEVRLRFASHESTLAAMFIVYCLGFRV